MIATLLKRILVTRGLCHPIVGAAISLIYRRRIPGKRFVFDAGNKHVSAANVARIFWGVYERTEAGYIRRFLRRDLDVVELGSSLGVVSLNIVSVQGHSCKLVCVEANPLLIETIKTNINLNAPRKEVAVINRAIDYSASSEVSFYIDNGNLGSHVGEEAHTLSVDVKTTTLSGLLQDYGFEDYALVSDIEGAEAGILIEDSMALQKCRQLIIELHPTTYKGQELSVNILREKLIEVYGFEEIAHRNDVYVFEKPYTVTS